MESKSKLEKEKPPKGGGFEENLTVLGFYFLQHI